VYKFGKQYFLAYFIVMLMMMIALITFKSSLAPLIEGLCSSNPCKFAFWGYKQDFIQIAPVTISLQ